VAASSAGPGKGSDFAVRLPLARSGSAAAPARAADGAGASVAGRRILVVDDNRDAAESLGLLLETMGHEVRVAHAGGEGLLAGGVLWVDTGRPDRGGWGVARGSGEGEGSGRAVLVAITGWGQDEDRQRAREAGFDHHLTKPVDPAELQRLLTAGAPADSGEPG